MLEEAEIGELVSGASDINNFLNETLPHLCDVLVFRKIHRCIVSWVQKKIFMNLMAALLAATKWQRDNSAMCWTVFWWNQSFKEFIVRTNKVEAGLYTETLPVSNFQYATRKVKCDLLKNLKKLAPSQANYKLISRNWKYVSCEYQ